MAKTKKYRQTFNLVNEGVMASCIQAVATAFKEYDGVVVSIKEGKEARTDAQNRLFHMWVSDVTKAMIGTGHGLNEGGWKRFYKDQFVRPLLLEQDESFYWQEERFIEYEAKFHGDKFLRNKLLDAMFHTSDLDVEHFTKLLDRMYEHASSPMVRGDIRSGFGLQLRVPADLEWLRIGETYAMGAGNE